MVHLFESLATDAHRDRGVFGVAYVCAATVIDLLKEIKPSGGRGQVSNMKQTEEVKALPPDGPSASSPSKRPLGWIDKVRMDVFFAVRGLRKSPGFTLLAVASLAIGMGVTTATYTFADHVLWSGWSFHEPDRVVQVFEHDDTHQLVSWANFRDIEQQVDVFDGILAANLYMFALGATDASEVHYGEAVSADYFRVLGIQPVAGSFFDRASHASPEAPLTVVLSHHVWQNSFGGDPGAVGRETAINGHRATIVAVAPPEFGGTKWGVGSDLWIPMRTWGFLEGWEDWEETRRGQSLTVMARLRDGASLENANAALATVAARLADEYPETNRNVTFRATDRLRGDMGPELGSMPDLVGFLAIGAAALVLLVGCGNVASLLLARAVVRRREIAVRLALGAHRGQLLRLMLTESLLLAALAGGAGIGLAFFITDFFPQFLPQFAFRTVLDVEPGSRALVFTAALVVAAVIAFGVAPAAQASRADVAAAMQGDGHGAGTVPRTHLLSSVVVGMVALSFVTLFLAGLFSSSLQHARTLDPGFSVDNRVRATIPLQLARYEWRDAPAFFEELERRFSALPGVQRVGYGTGVPLIGTWSSNYVYADDREYRGEEEGVLAWRSSVSDSYFEAMGTQIVRGRGFGPVDGPEGPWATVLNEELAHRLWPDQDPLGKYIRFSLDSAAQPVQVIGIARNGLYFQAGERPEPAVYASFRQWPNTQAMVVVNTVGDPVSLVPGMRAELAEMDSNVPLHDVRAMDLHMQDALWLFRLGAGLGKSLAIISLILAAVGLYGVIAFTVKARRHELGVRIALGASRKRVVTMVLRRSLVLACAGTAIGLLLTLPGAELIRTLLVGVRPRDPVVLAVVTGFLLLTACVAGLGPALWASRADPVESLKVER
jgi:predicted permease